MAKIYYDPINGGTQIQIYDDPQVITKTDQEAELANYEWVKGFDDSLRTIIAKDGLPSLGIQGGYQDLDTFDDFLDDEIDRLSDVLDFYDYETGQANFSIVTGDWFLPEALETPLPPDDGTNVVANCIDAVGGGSPDPNDPLNTTYWQYNQAGLRVLTVRVRSYTKKVEGIRLRTNNGDTRAQLQNLTVKAANKINNLDDPENLEASGVNVDDSSSWFQIDFTKTKCKFVRLEFSTSAHSDPNITRIRSLQVRVGVTNHDK